jgi:hypothetical protein
MAEDLEALRGLVRRLHVHYDVDPEVEIRGDIRVTVAFQVRLWGLHAKGAHALPGCPKCHELRGRLQEIADFALAGDSGRGWAAIEPLRPALYDSRVLPGVDEIALRICVARSGVEAPVGEREERFLKAIREKLRMIDVPEV